MSDFTKPPSMAAMRLRYALDHHRHPDGVAVLQSIDPATQPVRLTSFEHLLDDEALFDQLIDAVLRRVEFHPSGCWLMSGTTDINGYPRLRFDGRTYLSAARVVCSLVYGPMVRQHDTRHSQACVARNCVNPEHLRPGSRADNMRDGRGKTCDFRDQYGRSNAERRRRANARKRGQS